MPKLQRIVVLSFCVASLVFSALACNLLVDDKFKSYVDGGCDFGGRDSRCGRCIAQECSSHVAKICMPTDDGGRSKVLEQIEACAEAGASDARASSPCLQPAADGATTLENTAYNCVHDNCVNVFNPSCALRNDQDGGGSKP